MADTIKSSNEISIRFSFEDSDNRLITLSNKRPNITSADIKTVGNYFKTNNLIIGDKTGAKCEGISEAYTQEQTKTKLDLT